MPWQRDAAMVTNEIDPETGLPWYGIVVVTVPRQAGKTTLVSDDADFTCLSRPRARVWYTAQTGKDASAWMRDEHFEQLSAASIFGRPGSPRCKYTLSRRAGQEGVSWGPTRSTFRVFPPLRDGLHGKQSDKVYEDEVWAFSAAQGADVRQAVRPTMATRRGSQLWVVSTKGDDSSVYFDGYVDLGEASLAIANTRVCFIDYGIPDDADPSDLDVIAAHHPAVGYTISRDTLQLALDEFLSDPESGGLDGFARAYGNRSTRTRQSVFSAALWSVAGRGYGPVPARVGLAFDVTPAGDRAAIAAAWREWDEDQAADVLCAEVLYAESSVRELPALLAALARKFRVAIAYDPVSLGTLDVVDALRRNYPAAKVAPVNTGQYGSACLSLERAVNGGLFRHSNQKALNEAVEVAVKRPLGDGGFGYGRKASAGGSIAELVAVALAGRQYDTQPRKGPTKIILPSGVRAA